MMLVSHILPLEYNCTELKVLINRQDLLFDDRKKPLVKFRDMYEAINNIHNFANASAKLSILRKFDLSSRSSLFRTRCLGVFCILN